MNIHIQGGRLINPGQQYDQVADLWISEGKVVAIGAAPKGFIADQVIDAAGKVVCPGFVDLQANLCEPGFTQKGTIRTELSAAAAGGVTALCCPPTTAPVMDSGAVVNLVKDRVQEVATAQVLPIGALTQKLGGEHLANIVGLADAGCVAFSNGPTSIAKTQTLLRCFEYAATFDLLLYLRPGDVELSKNGCAHEGETSFRMGLVGIPETAETLDVARCLLLAEQTGARLHLAQLSTARAAEMVADAQQRGVKVTADVAIQNLLLTDTAISGFDSAYHLQPPLRSETDRQGLLKAVASGVIGAICSAHQPQDAAAKQAPFASTEAGMIGLQTLLPLGLKLVQQGELDLITLIDRLTVGPATAISQPLGSLSEGVTANVCIFDELADWQWDENSNRSLAANSPYFGQRLKGKVTHTIYAGQLVYSD